MKKETTKKNLEKQEFFYVHATADAKKEKVVREGDTFTVSVKEPAERNLANKRIKDIIASELDVAPSHVRLYKGHRSERKLFLVSR